MRRLAVLLVLLGLVAACSGGGTMSVSDLAQRPTPTPEPTPTATATPTPTPQPTPTPEPVRAPLTGAPAPDVALLTRPVVGVKVDNAPDARPQVGLEDADIVFEELVEGGVTRFLAVYHSVDPGVVGPVRSGRDVDADLFPPFNGVLAISGAAPSTYSELFAADLRVFEEGQAGGAIFRVRDRPAPHNLDARIAQLAAAGGDAPPAAVPWPHDAAVPAGGETIANARLLFSDRLEASWVWRPQGGVWERGQNGTQHLTASGEQVSATTVVIPTVAVGSGGGVDVTGAATVAIRLIDEGDAMILRDGQMFAARWRKTAADAQFEWLTLDGQPFPLAPGPTWVELLPVGGTVTPNVAEPSADQTPTEDPSATPTD